MIEVPTYRKVSGMVLWCVRDLGFRPVVVEIGCDEGEGVARYAPECSAVVAVDAMGPSGPCDVFDDGGEPPVPDVGRIKRFWDNVKSCGNVELVVGISQRQATIDAVSRSVGDAGIDVLVIDGTHHPAEAVERDFDGYFPLIRRRGFVVFDDIYEPAVRSAYDACRTKARLDVRLEWRSSDPGVLQEIGVLTVAHVGGEIVCGRP